MQYPIQYRITTHSKNLEKFVKHITQKLYSLEVKTDKTFPDVCMVTIKGPSEDNLLAIKVRDYSTEYPVTIQQIK